MDLDKSSGDAPPGPVPGWYADPENPGSERYWDGTFWSDQRRPAGSADVTPSTSNAPPPSSGFAVTALVCGIIGVVTFWIYVGLVLGIIAIVFGVLGRKRAQNEPGDGKNGMATAGLVLGIIATAATLLWILFIVILVSETVNSIDNLTRDFSYCLEHPDDVGC